MKEFTYVIKEELGLHARPAGLLVKEAKKFQSATTLAAKGKTAAAGKLIAIMSTSCSALFASHHAVQTIF